MSVERGLPSALTTVGILGDRIFASAPIRTAVDRQSPGPLIRPQRQSPRPPLRKRRQPPHNLLDPGSRGRFGVAARVPAVVLAISHETGRAATVVQEQRSKNDRANLRVLQTMTSDPRNSPPN